jgi:succinoglycan biosynthesis transport protein ExoP
MNADHNPEEARWVGAPSSRLVSVSVVPRSESVGLSLADYAAIVWRRKWLVVIPIVVVTFVAMLLTLSETQLYRSSTEVLVKEPPSATAIGAPERPMQQRVLQNELQRAQGSEIQRQVREIIGPEPLIGVRLAASEDVDVFVFTAESSSPEEAAEAANEYANVYIAERRASLTVDLEAQALVLGDQIQDIDQEIADASAGDASGLGAQRESYEFQLEQLTTSIRLAQQSGASVIDAASVPGAPFQPKPIRTAALSIAFGAIIGLLAAFLVDFFDNSLRSEADLGEVTGLTVLGVIPKLKDWEPADARVVTIEKPASPPSEAYRAFRTAVQYGAFERGLKVIQITSAKPGDGKTTTSVNLAVACARAGSRVLLIDCDLRRPRVHDFFGLDNTVGFTTVMVGGSHDEIVRGVDGESHLSVISSGPILPDPSELLAGATAERFIRGMADQYDLVILDSPPVLAVADPLVLSSYADALIVVASSQQSDRRDVVRAIAQLSQLDVEILGVVLNSFEAKSSSDYRQTYGVYEASSA